MDISLYHSFSTRLPPDSAISATLTNVYDRAGATFNRPPRYRTYLLTLWQEQSQNSGQAGDCRFRLEDPRTGRKQAFASLGALMAVLQDILNESAVDDAPQARS